MIYFFAHFVMLLLLLHFFLFGLVERFTSLYREDPTDLMLFQGLHASQDEINSTTLKMTEIDEELGLLGFQGRIVQGRETAHFLQLFKGKLMIFKGKGIDFDGISKTIFVIQPVIIIYLFLYRFW